MPMSKPIIPTSDLHQIPEVTEGYVNTFYPVRFLPYKPQAVRQMKGKKGRWQRMNEYAGWENMETPHEVWPDHVDIAALIAERDALRETNANEKSNDCPPGCTRFHGGEVRHLRECPHYPESRTKMYDDVVTERDALRAALRKLDDEPAITVCENVKLDPSLGEHLPHAKRIVENSALSKETQP